MSLTNEQVAQALGNLTVLELIALTLELEEKWGVKAEPVISTTVQAPVNAPPAQEQTEFDVTFVSFVADKKISLIKLIREVTGLGLMEAKAMVEALPKSIKSGVSKEEAEALKAKFTEAGAVMEVK